MTRAKPTARLSAPDYFLMHRVNRWRPPRWIRVWMLAASRAGDGWLWWCCGLAVLGSNDTARHQAFAAAALAGLFGILTFKILNGGVGRKPPCPTAPPCSAN